MEINNYAGYSWKTPENLKPLMPKLLFVCCCLFIFTFVKEISKFHNSISSTGVQKVLNLLSLSRKVQDGQK